MREYFLFGHGLVAIGEHVIANPGLPEIYSVGVRNGLEDHDTGIEVRLFSQNSAGPAVLAAWAATLSSVTSSADRINKDLVMGEVVGMICDHRVTVVAKLPSELFPAESVRHAWHVNVLLQEA